MEHVVQEFFKQESLLSVSCGQDGLLGFFASNFPTIVGMTRAIQKQQDATYENQQDALIELEDLRDKLSGLDALLSQHGCLSDADRADYSDTTMKINHYEELAQKQDPIFYNGKPLKMCPEMEFIIKVNVEFPGLLQAICEFDRLLRIPIAGFAKRGLGWALTPLKMVIGAVIGRSNLGVAGNLIWMLVDTYPDLIRKRMEAVVPEDAPDDYDENDMNGYGVKEIKEEIIIKHNQQRRKDKN